MLMMVTMKKNFTDDLIKAYRVEYFFKLFYIRNYRIILF